MGLGISTLPRATSTRGRTAWHFRAMKNFNVGLAGMALTLPGRLARRVRVAAIQRTETAERYVKTAVTMRLDEHEGLVVVLPKDLADLVKAANVSTPVQYVIAAVKASLER